MQRRRADVRTISWDSDSKPPPSGQPRRLRSSHSTDNVEAPGLSPRSNLTATGIGRSTSVDVYVPGEPTQGEGSGSSPRDRSVSEVFVNRSDAGINRSTSMDVFVPHGERAGPGPRGRQAGGISRATAGKGRPAVGINRAVSVDVPRSQQDKRPQPQLNINRNFHRTDSSPASLDNGRGVNRNYQRTDSKPANFAQDGGVNGNVQNTDSSIAIFANDNDVARSNVGAIVCSVGSDVQRDITGSDARGSLFSLNERPSARDTRSASHVQPPGSNSREMVRPGPSRRLRSSGSSRVDQRGTTRLLKIKVISGNNLAKKDIFGASDPYVRITLYRGDRDAGIIDTVHTATKKKTLNPIWEEEFLFRVNPRDNVLLFEVFDSNRVTRDDFLGLVEIPLDHTMINLERPEREISCKDYILRPRSIRSRVRGQLWLYLAYVPDGDSDESPEDAPTQEPGWELVDGFSTVSLDEADGTVNPTPTSTSNDVGASGPVQEETVTTETTSPAPLEPLPPGWEEKTHASGRTYYINHTHRTTQWERPTSSSSGSSRSPRGSRSPRNQTNRQSATSDQAGSRGSAGDGARESAVDGARGSAGTGTGAGAGAQSTNLPQGWEERQDANGRTYYVDHNSRRTCWELPTEATPEPEQTTPEENRSRAAAMYRQRRHISTEDTISLGPEGANASPHSRRQEFSQQSPGQNQVIDEEPLPPGWATGVAPNGRVFYIDHNTAATTWEDPRKPRSGSVRRSADDSTPLSALRPSSNEDLLKNLGPLPDGWEERTHTDGRVFYINHRSRQTQWEDPRLQKLGGPAVPYSRDFKRKYDYFRSKLRKPNNVPNKLDIKVTRKNVFEDSYRAVMSVKRSELLKTRLWIEFDGEVGLDYGGVAREWFFLLSREMFNPYYGLFEYSATDNYTLQINSLSGVFNEDHLNYFQFVGRVAGMAVYHGKLLDAFFIRPFYKMMLGKKITLDDMESVDSEYYNSMCYIRDNDPECLDLYFSIEEDYFGEITERELKPGGRNILVTNENKMEYLDLVTKWRFVARVEHQMKSFAKGFNELIPNNHLQIFDENELELLMCGLQDIDVNDWKTHTAYKGEYNPNHPVILHFWKAIYSFNNETRARFLQFVTGTSRVPMNGFRELHGSNGPQQFTIEKWGQPEKLPRAHTCFNRIDLPPYETYAELRSKLIIAIENAQGFEGVD